MSLNESLLSEYSTTTEAATLSEGEKECLEHPQWLTFVMSSIVTYVVGRSFWVSFGGILLVLIGRFVTCLCCPSRDGYEVDECRQGKELGLAEKLLSNRNTAGKVMNIITFLNAAASLIVFAIDARGIVEVCIVWTENKTLQADLVLNGFFLVHFTVRLIAAPNKLRFMWELITLVDFCTIPHTFVAICLDRTWIGLRFLRAFHFVRLPKMLTQLNWLETGPSFIGVQRMANVAVTALVVAGAIYVAVMTVVIGM